MDTLDDRIVLGVRELNSTIGLTLRVTMWSPVETGHGDFQCRYQIAGAGDERVRGSIGIDGIQAVLLALRKVGSDIDFLEQQLSTKFFIGSGEVLPDHGFLNFEAMEAVTRRPSDADSG
jgi:hypothetical protein